LVQRPQQQWQSAPSTPGAHHCLTSAIDQEDNQRCLQRGQLNPAKRNVNFTSIGIMAASQDKSVEPKETLKRQKLWDWVKIGFVGFLEMMSDMSLPPDGLSNHILLILRTCTQNCTVYARHHICKVKIL
jgi:hypothetical protein